MCIRCPGERTSIASKGRERIILEAPALIGCDGNPVSEGAHFKALYGPNIGTLLREGSHITVGSIVVNNKVYIKKIYIYFHAYISMLLFNS